MNLIINMFLCLAGGFFLIANVFVRDLHFVASHLDAHDFSFLNLLVLQTDLLNICLELGLFELKHFFLFLAVFLTGSNLVDDDLSTTFTGGSCPLFTRMLRLNCLQTLYLHHHVKSLLFFDPVLFQLFVLVHLNVSDCVDPGG